MEFRKNSMLLKFTPILTLIAVSIFFNGCKNDSPVTPANYNTSASIFAENNPSNNNTLVLESVKFLIREIELESEGGEHGAEIEFGPVVVNVNLFSKVLGFSFANLPSGVYKEIEFKIQKPNSTEPIPDPEFREGPNGELRYSIIIRGAFNGTTFVFKSGVSVEKELEFEEHNITVPLEGIINITIRINPYTWFLRDGSFIDPSNPDNLQYIDQNIRTSFNRAFKDDDKNGEPD